MLFQGPASFPPLYGWLFALLPWLASAHALVAFLDYILLIRPRSSVICLDRTRARQDLESCGLELQQHGLMPTSPPETSSQTLESVQAELSRCRKRLWREGQAVQNWGLSRAMMQTSVWIYVLSKYNLSAASEFAKQMQQKRKKYVSALRGRLPAEPPISD